MEYYPQLWYKQCTDSSSPAIYRWGRKRTNSSLDFEILYNYNFTSPSADSAEFNLKSYLITQLDTDPARVAFRWNDAITRNQVFKNYYAYDDGSVENGYGLFGEGADGAMVAMKFN